MSATITRERLANAVIVASSRRDRERPRLCAIAYVPDVGPREILADDFADAEAARRWLKAQAAMTPGGEA